MDVAQRRRRRLHRLAASAQRPARAGRSEGRIPRPGSLQPRRVDGGGHRLPGPRRPRGRDPRTAALRLPAAARRRRARLRAGGAPRGERTVPAAGLRAAPRPRTRRRPDRLHDLRGDGHRGLGLGRSPRAYARPPGCWRAATRRCCAKAAPGVPPSARWASRRRPIRRRSEHMPSDAVARAHRHAREHGPARLYAVVRLLAALVPRTWFRLRVAGAEHPPRRAPVVARKASSWPPARQLRGGRGRRRAGVSPGAWARRGA